MHDAVLRELAVLVQPFDLGLGVAGAEMDFVGVCSGVAGHGAQFVGGLGQRRRSSEETHVGKPSAHWGRCHAAGRFPAQSWPQRNIILATLLLAGHFGSLPVVGAGWIAVEQGISEADHGPGRLAGTRRRRARRAEAAGSTLSACSRMSQAAALFPAPWGSSAMSTWNGSWVSEPEGSIRRLFPFTFGRTAPGKACKRGHDRRAAASRPANRPRYRSRL